MERLIFCGGHKINNLRHAGDTTLIASSIDELIKIVERVETASQEIGFKINRTKTKVMIVNRAILLHTVHDASF